MLGHACDEQVEEVSKFVHFTISLPSSGSQNNPDAV